MISLSRGSEEDRVSWMRQQVIVTGATGFVGRHVVAALRRPETDIVVLVRQSDRLAAFDWGQNVTPVTYDLHGDAPDFVPAPGAALVHLAWSKLDDYHSLDHVDRMLPSSFRLIEGLVAGGVRRVLVAGTCLEFGMRHGPIRASAPGDPRIAYAIGKDALRRLLVALQARVAFELRWARLFYLYGPGQREQSLLMQLDAAIDRGDAIFPMSGGEQLRDYLRVETAAQQLVSALDDKRDGPINICSGTPISVRTLVERRIQERGARIKPEFGRIAYPQHEPLAFWGLRGSEDSPITTAH